MRHQVRTITFAWVVIIALALFAVIFLVPGKNPPLPPLPNPNGYDDFIQASKRVTLKASAFPEQDEDSLRLLIFTNAEALRLLRVGLTRPCALPMDSQLASTNLDQLADMKSLVQLLAAEGHLRELENRPADAAHSYMDAIRFGNAMSQGGVLITRLVGVACEAIGCRNLAQIVPKLSPPDARALMKELEQLDAGRITWEEVRKNEAYFEHHQTGPAKNPLIRLIFWRETHQAMRKAESRHKLIIAHERLVAGELALRGYAAEQGHPPVHLEELVSNYLARVPMDPFSGRPMVYHPKGTNWLFYSVGSDGVDDGGSPAGRGTPAKGDLHFDSSW